MKKIRLEISKNSKKFFIFSLILMFVAVGSFVFKGLNYGIDFIGGTIVNIELSEEFTTEQIKEITDKYDESASITTAGDENTQVIISTKLDLSEEVRADLFADFKEAYELENEALLSIDNVSATIGGELQRQAILASLITVLCILIYISFRFEMVFGICAVIALVHDLIIVVGVYSIFQIEVNTSFIAAILTILGYSINDTIVVFDRVRENKRKYGKHEYGLLIDDSVNQTLARSVFTTITTLLAIIPLYIFGGASIEDFVLPMIIGFIAGVYSSIFIASPLWCTIKEKLYLRQKALKKAR